MTQTSTMFLNELTILDHAYIGSDGQVIGGSFNPSFLVTGKIDPQEKVVVDFSTIKKRLKQYIDDDTYGFDHKCWYIQGFSQGNIFVNNERVTDFNLLTGDHFDPKSRVQIETATFTMMAPKDAFKFVPFYSGYENYSIDNVGKWLEFYLNDILSKESISVECNNNINAHTFKSTETNPISLFTYVHGLKDSTSWGCQNLGHGHLSYLQLESDAPADQQKLILDQICDDLDYTLFINKENIVTDDEGELTIRYESSRGHFECRYYKNTLFDRRRKLKVLDTETTVEFLAEYVKNTYAGQLQSINATGLFISEGLSKGAYVKL